MPGAGSPSISADLGLSTSALKLPSSTMPSGVRDTIELLPSCELRAGFESALLSPPVERSAEPPPVERSLTDEWRAVEERRAADE